MDSLVYINFFLFFDNFFYNIYVRDPIEDKLAFIVCCGGKEGNKDKQGPMVAQAEADASLGKSDREIDR